MKPDPPDDQPTRRCKECDGSGVREGLVGYATDVPNMGYWVDETEECPVCEGNGWVPVQQVQIHAAVKPT